MKRQLHIVYVDLNELMIQRECLCSAKKGHQLLLLPVLPLFTNVVFLYTSVPPLFAPPRQPFACPPITHRYTHHTVRSHHRHYFDCHLSPPPPVCGGPAAWSSHWHFHRVHFPSLLFLNGQSCLFFNMWGRGVLMILILFFISKMGGEVCESSFSSFRRSEAHPMPSRPCPSLSVSHAPPLPSPPFPPAPFVSVCVHCVNHCPR